MDHNFYKVWYQHNKQVWWVNMHNFVANLLGYAATENYWNWTIFSQVFTKSKKGDVFFETHNNNNFIAETYPALILSLTLINIAMLISTPWRTYEYRIQSNTRQRVLHHKRSSFFRNCVSTNQSKVTSVWTDNNWVEFGLCIDSSLKFGLWLNLFCRCSG